MAAVTVNEGSRYWYTLSHPIRSFIIIIILLSSSHNIYDCTVYTIFYIITITYVQYVTVHIIYFGYPFSCENILYTTVYSRTIKEVGISIVQ